MSLSARIALGLGLSLGLSLGLYYAWVLNPVEYVDTAPDSLRADYKAEWALMVAEAYSADGDLDSARAALAVLGLPDADDYLTELVGGNWGRVATDAQRRALAQLAHDLGGDSPTLEPFLP